MDDDATEPIPSAAPLAERVRGQLTPSRMIAGISTTVAIVAVAALVFVVTGEEPADNAADERPAPAVAASAPEPAEAPAKPLAAAPAPAPAAQPDPAPSPAAEPVASAPGSAAGTAHNPLFTGLRPASPSVSAAPAEARPPFPFAPARPDTWAPPQLPMPGVDPQRAVETVVGAVTGTAGWVGTGVFDVLGAMIIANGTGNWAGGPPRPEAALAALLLPPVTGGPGLPPPAVDVSRIPPPSLDFMRGVPPPNLDFLRSIPPPQPPPPPNLDFLRSIPPPQPLAPPNLGFLQSIPPPRF